MTIVKSLHATLFTNQYRFRDKYYFNIGIGWPFRLTDGCSILEQSFWQAVGKHFSSECPVEEGFAKQRGEFLVYGDAVSFGDKEITSLGVSVSFGSKTKQLLVSGDRYWMGAIPSPPKPFQRMPLNYNNAFGGDKFQSNLLGKGYQPNDEGKYSVPNVEYPSFQQSSEGKPCEVAGFGGLDARWQQRTRYLGTYDNDYLKNHMPGLAPDMNLLFFQRAPSDQQFSGFLTGEESYRITNMNPQHSEICGTLPRIKGRCFVSLVDLHSENEHKSEVSLNLDTVYLFPTEDVGLLIHRGVIEVQHPQGLDVKHLLLAHENQGEMRDSDHYIDQLNKRTDPEESWRYLLNTSPLIPYDCVCGIEQLSGSIEIERPRSEAMGKYATALSNKAIEQSKEDIQKQKDEIKAQLSKLDGDNFPDEIKQLKDKLSQLDTSPGEPDFPEQKALDDILAKLLPKKKNNPAELDISKIDLGAMEELKLLMEQIQKTAQAKTKDDIKLLIDDLIKQKNASDNEIVKTQLSATITRLEPLLLPPQIPKLPRFYEAQNAPSVNETITKEIEDKKSLFLEVEGLDEQKKAELINHLDKINIPEIDNHIEHSIQQGIMGYVKTAHYIPEATSPHPGNELNKVSALLEAIKTTNVVSGNISDVAFGIFSQTKITGISCQFGLLEYAQFHNCEFVNVDFSYSVFAHAEFNQCHFENCQFISANLGAMQISLSTFKTCDFIDATFSKTHIKSSNFIDCDLGKRQDMWLESSFRNTTFQGCDFSEHNFIELDLTECTYIDCMFAVTNFVKPVLAKSKFEKCIFSETNLVEGNLEYSSFLSCTMKNVRFVGKCNLSNSVFEKTTATESNFRETNLSKTKFNHSRLDKSDFGMANCEKSDFSYSHAIGTQFLDTNLTGSIFKRANLMDASLMQAIISDCLFEDANCYNVSFLNATIKNASFNGAILTNTILQDWHP